MAFRFREFKVYGDIKQFINIIYKITAHFPKDELYGIVSQLRRAAVSIALNLAEGSDRGSDREFKRFVQMSMSSTNEVVAALDISLDNKYLSVQEHGSLLVKAESIIKRLSKLCMKLQSDEKKP